MKRLGKLIVGVLVTVTLVVVVAAVLIPALTGMQRYVITGGSMTGTISKGSIVYARLTPVEQLKVGDIITFVPPAMSAPVTHRIIAIQQSGDGKLVFRTKGDFNKVADPWRMTLREPEQARYVFHIPYLGYLLAALAIRQVRIVVVGIPAVIIALSLLVSLWREAGEEVRKQEAAEAAEQAGGEPS